MDEELVQLQRQFELAQQVKSTVRLSERNVVELVQKLHHLQIIDFDLLHTVSGKEYITPEQLRNEMVGEMKKVGRMSLIDLAEGTGVDLYHVEKQAHHIVSHDSSIMLINGEIISNSYWDTAAEEINERLEEYSQISIAELAAQLQIGSELLVSVLQPRLGTLVKGRLEGGQLYTPAYVARVNAMVRGAARAIFVPINTSALWNSLQEMDGAVSVALEPSFFQSLFNALAKQGHILGSLRAGVHWTPTVFAIARKDCVDSFFSQNSFITYETLQKLGIPQPSQFLQSRYPEGIPLDASFAHPSMIDLLDAAVEDAIERNSWIDSLTVLPASFGIQDAFKILSLCPSVRSAQKSNRALILGDSYIFSNGFVKDMFVRIEKEMETINICGPVDECSSEVNEGSNDATQGSKKKKGKSSTDNQESKAKRSQKKGKVSSSSSQARKDEEKSFISEEWVVQKITSLNPDFEEQGFDDPDMILLPLARHLRPLLLNSWNERRKAAFTENAQKMKKLLDSLQKKLDELYLSMQLYEKALDLFEDDQSTSVLLHKHLLRTTGASMVDTLLVNLDMHNKLKVGVLVEPANPETVSLSSGDRSALAKSLPGLLAAKATATVEALEGKRVESFMSALREVSEESGLTLKKLDKKLERTLLHSYRKDLASQVSAEIDPISLLPQVISLLYVQVYGKALQAPGRAVSAAVSRLKEKLDDSAFKTLVDYQSGTVSVLALMSAATGDEEDCSSERILDKRELLEGLMPALKGLVLGTAQR